MGRLCFNGIFRVIYECRKTSSLTETSLKVYKQLRSRVKRSCGPPVTLYPVLENHYWVCIGFTTRAMPHPYQLLVRSPILPTCHPKRVPRTLQEFSMDDESRKHLGTLAIKASHTSSPSLAQVLDRRIPRSGSSPRTTERGRTSTTPGHVTEGRLSGDITKPNTT